MFPLSIPYVLECNMTLDCNARVGFPVTRNKKNNPANYREMNGAKKVILIESQFVNYFSSSLPEEEMELSLGGIIGRSLSEIGSLPRNST